MEEKRLITFKELKTICCKHFYSGDPFCISTDNKKEKCLKENCPVFEKLEKPHEPLQITPAGGK
ncbi:MAG: hypothetical protein A2017_18185 [Lentisphaerae bacterium GWF2_44_16]|nr:MAG: hypothetical protein A2017_18185 [Lentisphaerae bacterium GWF2_44_16]